MKIVSKNHETVDQHRLLGTDNASVWAEEFAKIFPEIDQTTMIGWFASCAETAKTLQRAAKVEARREVQCGILSRYLERQY